MTLKLLQQQVCFIFLHKCLILSRSCDCIDSGTKEWILVAWTSYPILLNTKRPFWSMWRMNTVSIIDVCWSINLTGWEDQSGPLCNVFHTVSIHLSSIWFVQRGWRLLNAEWYGWEDTQKKRSCSMLNDHGGAEFEMAAWSDKELEANQS